MSLLQPNPNKRQHAPTPSQATTPLSVGNIANEALKISMEAFNEKKVIGSAIKTKMFFENRKQGFSLRKAS